MLSCCSAFVTGSTQNSYEAASRKLSSSRSATSVHPTRSARVFSIHARQPASQGCQAHTPECTRHRHPPLSSPSHLRALRCAQGACPLRVGAPSPRHPWRAPSVDVGLALGAKVLTARAVAQQARAGVRRCCLSAPGVDTHTHAHKIFTS